MRKPYAYDKKSSRSGKARRSDAKVVRIRTESNRRAIFKTAFSLLLVFAQLGIIVSLNFLFVMGLRWYLLVLAVVSVVTAVSVLSSHRSTQSKAVWVLFILVFFVFGFVIYVMSNDRVMYARPRKRHKAIYEKTAETVAPYADPEADEDTVRVCRYLHAAGGFVPYTHTDLAYFSSAASAYDDMLERLKKAEKFVFIEFFAIADGVLLGRTMRVLKDRIDHGVDVRIIYDDMGSRAISHKSVKEIRKAGAQIRVFNRLVSRFTFALNYRDHRKIVVIDGKTAYTGGFNLADEYVNEKRMHGYWKDAGLRLTGEAVDAMTLIFLRQWEYIVRKPVDYAAFTGLSAPARNTSTVVPYAGGPEFEQAVIKSVMENVISSARRKLYVMTPYFVPDESVMQAIVNAAMSGVDVRLVLPAVPDKAYVYLLTRDNAEKLIRYGVKVYYLKDAFVHAKVLLSEKSALIGTANFDMRSFYQQFENAVFTDDKDLIASVEEDFEKTFPDCALIAAAQKNGFLKATAIKALRIVAPLM